MIFILPKVTFWNVRMCILIFVNKFKETQGIFIWMKFHPFSHTKLSYTASDNLDYSMSHMKRVYDTFMLLFFLLLWCLISISFIMENSFPPTWVSQKKISHTVWYTTQRCLKDDRIFIFPPIPLKVNHLWKMTRHNTHLMSQIFLFHKYCSKFTCPRRGQDNK